MKLKKILFVICFLAFGMAKAQFLTREDSLNAGITPSMKSVILSGYGEAKYVYDVNQKTAKINLTRNVLFVGYKFSNKITFFSEMEVEDAKLDGGGGEIAMEQCVLKFDLNRNQYLLAGLFLPRIGLMNENHLPITFHGNDRPKVEKWVIPSTWRELGIGFYGSSLRMPGLNYSIALVNGLDGKSLTGGTGIRDGRFEGRDASATNLACTGSLLYFRGPWRIQLSGYIGGTIGMSPSEAKLLNLQGGTFGTPAALGEGNLTYRKNGFSFKGLAAYGAIPDAKKLNHVYQQDVSSSFYGYYVEGAYDLLEKTKYKADLKQFNLFLRYEGLNLVGNLPSNAQISNQHMQQYLISGFTYLPTRGVAVKLDWNHVVTGGMGLDTFVKGSNASNSGIQANDYLQLGIAYSF